MNRCALVLCFALLGSIAAAEINDARAIELARPYITRFAPEAQNDTPQVSRDQMPKAAGGPIENVRVHFGEAVVWFGGSGEFIGFANMGNEANRINSGGPYKYKTNTEAWKALEAILLGFDVPDGLTQKKLFRETAEGQPFSVRFTMEPRPYGYEADGGNSVNAELHQKTGRVLTLNISSGWTYEAPNVRVSPEQAIETTRLAHGGDVKDWKAKLKYSSVADRDAPPYTRQLRDQKTMRLYYSVWSKFGNTMVDSVTGDIVGFLSPPVPQSDQQPKATAAPPAPSPMTKVPGTQGVNLGPSISKQEKAVGMWRGILAAVVLLLILGGGALARSLRLRA